ncbi:hypothetical protein VTN02DRAFT_4664 [Thermoascus thermophilus]
MLSSPESDHFSHEEEEEEEEEEVEEATHPGARTPTGAGAGARPTAVHDELSPPGSMTQKQQQPQPQQQHNLQQGQGPGQGPGQGANGAEKPQPGASWMNKRAEEEYQRAMEYVVDREFSLREFGDPFDERDLTESVL